MFRYFLIILVFFCGCKNAKKVKTERTVIFSKFPKQQNVALHNLIKYDNGVVSRLYLTDTSLIAYDWRGQGGYFFYEYGLQSKQNINKYMPHGRGKGQGLGSLSAGIYKNSLWMYDIILNKIIFADLNGSSSSADAIVYKEYPFTEKYYNIQFLSDKKIVANGNYQTPNKIQEVNLNSGKIVADFGVLDGLPKSIPFYAWKRANEAFMALNRTQNKVVLANRFNDNIEIFDLESHKSVKVKGPENYKIEFAFFKSDENKDLIQRNEKSRYGFVRVMATNKNIYALYSGNNRDSNYIDYAKTLYVYNWEGQPMKKLNLDRYISGFTVSNDDKTLYAYDVVSKFIVTTKI
ncbi:hypothetical protein ACVWYG_003696 [Pedobacter sp. UYEF25]